jgi:hypothetical protein
MERREEKMSNETLIAEHHCHAIEELKKIRKTLLLDILGDVSEADYIIKLVTTLRTRLALMEGMVISKLFDALMEYEDALAKLEGE